MTMEAPAVPQLHHVALTVRDVDASIGWYEQIFGLRYVTDVPHEGGVGKLLADSSGRVVFALHRHDSADGEAFTETRTGLDHVGLNVEKRADLDTWAKHLEDHGVVRCDVADKPLTQSPVVEAPYASVLVFRDPDNIQLELFAPLAR